SETRDSASCSVARAGREESFSHACGFAEGARFDPWDGPAGLIRLLRASLPPTAARAPDCVRAAPCLADIEPAIRFPCIPVVRRRAASNADRRDAAARARTDGRAPP